jgi:hypothetical protein
MQRTANILTAVTLVAALGAGAAIASNKNAYKLPDEVHASSIKVPENTETQAEFAKYASVTQQQAEAAARGRCTARQGRAGPARRRRRLSGVADCGAPRARHDRSLQSTAGNDESAGCRGPGTANTKAATTAASAAERFRP